MDGIPGIVFAVVCLVRWNPRSRDGHQFGYKDMSENMGPCEADCPAAILELLSPTDHEYALDWRARCRANLVLRARKLSDGDRIRLPERSEARRVGKEGVRTCRSRWSPSR